MGRLRDGVGRDQLTAELEANSASYRESFGAHGDAANDVNVEPLVDAVVGERKSTFTALVGAALAVLAIACANVAALYLGWRAARQRETAIRAALGASRWRLVAEIFGEALTIAALAGVVGTIIAAAALFALSDLLAAHLPSGTAVRLDPSAAAVGIFSVVASMCVIGLGPILKLNALGNLTTAQRGSSTSIAGSRFRAGLVVAETALSVALLVVAILLLVSLARLLTTSPGFDGTQVAAGYVNLPSDRYDSDERNLAFHLAVIERLGTMPGVEGAAAVFGLPFHDENYAHTYLPAGEPVVPPSERMRAGLRIVSEDYFRLMGMRIVAGRSFNADDRGSAPRVCIINESLHRRLGAGAATLGRVLLRGRNADQGCEIVGVVADVKTNGLKESTPDEIFYSVRQLPRRDTFYVVRTTGDPDAAAGLLRSAVSEQDSRIPVSRFASMNARYARMLGAERVMGGIISALAVAAVALATLGLFAVLSHAVINRTAEIGIRMAMGSSRGAVVGLIVQQGLGLVVAGVVIGSAVAWGASQLLSAQLFGIESAGPVYLVVAAIFLIIGGLAALGPALRGASIDPVAALRR